MLLKSWVASANTPKTDFPLNNLPYGSFDTPDGPSCCVAIGDMVLDLSQMEMDDMIEAAPGEDMVFYEGKWNEFMSLGPQAWADFRALLTGMLEAGSSSEDEISVYCLLYTSPSPRDGLLSRMPSSA